MIKRSLAILSLVVLSVVSLSAQENAAPSVTAPAEALKNAQGLSWIVITPATGDASPTEQDFVTLDYTGWNASGEVFDSTAKHPNARTFALAKLFPALRDTVGAMKIGEKRRVWIPDTLAPKKAPIVMDVTLSDITRVETPADVAAPPADAEKSKSGLAWKVLKPGDGSGHPKGDSYVTVNYTGWTTDGKMFDSSLPTGTPTTFRLNAVIDGWREGMQMMSPGEKRRFWIPQKIAYKGQPGMPAGMLVFDVELVKYK